MADDLKIPQDLARFSVENKVLFDFIGRMAKEINELQKRVSELESGM